ncbi:unnamed protein product [Calicophoron daubneyi]|uniref:Uncharacterized protein n=1 Tax=Calicophoron daubneyi TaxID=300641 RepID=A0AAV2TN67_CALDB
MVVLCGRLIIFGLLLLVVVPTNAVPTERPAEEQEQTTTPQVTTSVPAQPLSTDGPKPLEGSHTIIQPTDFYGEQEGKPMKRKIYRTQDVRRVERLCKYMQDFLACVRQGLPDCVQRLNAALKSEEERDQIKRLRRSHNQGEYQTICPNQLYESQSYENAGPVVVGGMDFRPPYNNPPPEGVILCVPNGPYPTQHEVSLPGIPMSVYCQPPISPVCGPVQELQPGEPAADSEWGPNSPQFVPQFEMIPGPSNPPVQGKTKQRYLPEDTILASHHDDAGCRHMNQPWMHEANPAEAQRIVLH